MIKKVSKLIKHNPLSIFAFNKILDFQCRNVKAYIFVATTGRSGSVTLYKIFQSIDNTTSFHEPSPVMFNDYLPGTDRSAYFQELFYKLKRVYINTAAKDYSYYIETNHQFVKNFIDPAVQCYRDRIKIIHLVRDPVSVASSFYRINSIPDKTCKRGRFYLIDPCENGNLINIQDLLYGNAEYKHDLYKCLWYWYEVESRIKEAKRKYPDVMFYRMKTENLNNEKKLLNMFEKLNIPVDSEKLAPFVGIRANRRMNEKVKEIDLDTCYSMHDKLLQEMEKRYGKNFWF